MKGVILSLPRKGKAPRRRVEFSASVLLRQNLPQLVFLLFFATGVLWGAMVSVNADKDFLKDMDFLFTTNLDSRLSLGLLGSFAAHFASDFIFVAVAVLCGLSPWGIGVLPFVFAFKGFGTGLSAAYLISTYGLKGLGFYLVVVLPGTFVFSVCLLFLCTEGARMSLHFAYAVFGKGDLTPTINIRVRKFLSRCAYFLFLSAVAAVCDMLLWGFASKLFF